MDNHRLRIRDGKRDMRIGRLPVSSAKFPQAALVQDTSKSYHELRLSNGTAFLPPNCLESEYKGVFSVPIGGLKCVKHEYTIVEV